MRRHVSLLKKLKGLPEEDLSESKLGQALIIFMGRSKGTKNKKVRTPIEYIQGKYKINTETGCWEWLGLLHTTGYVRFRVGDKKIYGHRYSYELKYGKIPEDLICCHTCDNPICINPDHIFLGTKKDNIRDAMTKGRFPTAVHPSHSWYQYGCKCDGCMKCMRDYHREHSRKKREEKRNNDNNIAA